MNHFSNVEPMLLDDGIMNFIIMRVFYKLEYWKSCKVNSLKNIY